MIPSGEYSASVGTEANDVSKDLELRELLVYGDFVALTMAFYGRSETTETWAMSPSC